MVRRTAIAVVLAVLTVLGMSGAASAAGDIGTPDATISTTASDGEYCIGYGVEFCEYHQNHPCYYYKVFGEKSETLFCVT